MKRLVSVAVVLGMCAVMFWGTGCHGSKTSALSLLTARQLYDKGSELYNSKKYVAAIEYFQQTVYNYPGESLVDSAQYFLSMSYFQNEEYQLAYTEFNRLTLNYPTSAFFETSMFMKAVSQYEETPKNSGLDQSSLQPAIKLFEDFLIDYPESDVIPQAKEYLLKARTRMAKKTYENAVVYERIRAFDAAKSYFQKVIDDYGDTQYGAPSQFKIAEIEYKQTHYQTAREKFQAYVKVFPQHEWVTKANNYMQTIEEKMAQQPTEGNAKS